MTEENKNPLKEFLAKIFEMEEVVDYVVIAGDGKKASMTSGGNWMRALGILDWAKHNILSMEKKDADKTK